MIALTNGRVVAGIMFLSAIDPDVVNEPIISNEAAWFALRWATFIYHAQPSVSMALSKLHQSLFSMVDVVKFVPRWRNIHLCFVLHCSLIRYDLTVNASMIRDTIVYHHASGTYFPYLALWEKDQILHFKLFVKVNYFCFLELGSFVFVTQTVDI